MGKTFQLFAPRVKVPPSSWHLHLAWSPDLTRHYWHTVYTYSIYHSRGRNAINTRERFHKREMKWRIVIFLQRKTGVRIRVKEKRRECTHTLQVPARARAHALRLRTWPQLCDKFYGITYNYDVVNTTTCNITPSHGGTLA